MPGPSALKPSGRSETTLPPVTTKASERAIIMVPSVTMNDGMRPLVVTMPFSQPLAGPIRSESRHAGDDAVLQHHRGRDRGRQRHHRADRDVELAGDHDDRHAGRHDQRHRHLAHQVGDVDPAQEARRQASPSPRPAPAAPPAPGSGHRTGAGSRAGARRPRLPVKADAQAAILPLTEACKIVLRVRSRRPSARPRTCP